MRRQPAREMRRTLGLESLETRNLLAGNVTVEVSGENLKLRGDRECNGVLIVQLGSGEYAVAGFFQDGEETTINGGTEPVIVRGVRGHFDIDLRQGDDILGIGNDVERLADLAEQLGFEGAFDDGGDNFGIDEIPDEQLDIRKSLHVKTKEGEDGVIITADVRHSIHINTGKHADGIAVADSVVGDDVVLHTEDGEDGVLVENSLVSDYLHVNTGKHGDTIVVSEVGLGHAFLLTGQGNDAVGLGEVEVDRELVVRTNQGNDEVVAALLEAERFDLDSGDGGDDIALGGLSIGRDLVVHAGSGNDEAALSESDVRGKLLLFLGAGHDELAIDDVGVGRDLHLDAGAGDDEVLIADSAVDQLLLALLGSGNDSLTVKGSAAERAVLRGGSGFDELIVDAFGFADEVDEDQFESTTTV